MEQTTLEKESVVITPNDLIEHWQAHRRLTRKTIKAFPDDKLFSYSVGGMRPFGELALEMLDMAAPGLEGLVTGKWHNPEDMLHISKTASPATKEELLKQWDETTNRMYELWEKMPASRFQEKTVAFNQWPGTVQSILFYFIDNEIHHRGQGYVYLRALGIEPPAFYDRE